MHTQTDQRGNTPCVIIPCYNEQNNVAAVIEEIAHAFAKADILIINDGSEDMTSEQANKSGKAQVIDLPINLGIGGAVQTGLKYALSQDYQYALKFDGDAQHDPVFINDLIQPLLRSETDIVIGSRFLTDNTGFKSTFWRRVGIKILKTVCRLLTGKTITDPTSGLRAYNQKAIEFMATHYPSFDYPEPEEIILAAKNGLKMQEVPVVMRERKSGQSTISSTLSVYYMLKVTLAMLFIYLRPPEHQGDK